MHRKWNLIFAWQCIYNTVHFFQVIGAFGTLKSGFLRQIEVIKIISLIYEGLVANQLPIVVYKDIAHDGVHPSFKVSVGHVFMAQVRKSVDSPPGMLTEDHHHTVHEESQVCYSSHLRPKSLHL